MVPERSASVNLDGGAPDGIAVTINVERAVGGAHDDRDRPARAALWLPVVTIIRKWAQHLSRKILRGKHCRHNRCFDDGSRHLRRETVGSSAARAAAIRTS